VPSADRSGAATVSRAPASKPPTHLALGTRSVAPATEERSGGPSGNGGIRSLPSASSTPVLPLATGGRAPSLDLLAIMRPAVEEGEDDSSGSPTRNATAGSAGLPADTAAAASDGWEDAFTQGAATGGGSSCLSRLHSDGAEDKTERKRTRRCLQNDLDATSLRRLPRLSGAARSLSESALPAAPDPTATERDPNLDLPTQPLDSEVDLNGVPRAADPDALCVKWNWSWQG
jgi:hypothetical protein